MTVAYMTLGDAAKGAIEAHETQQEHLEEVTERLASGEFHVPVSDGAAIPARCIDGRLIADISNYHFVPNAAGGTETLMVAIDLTEPGVTPLTTGAVYDELLTKLRKHHSAIGGHTGSHATDITSDCGANDKLSLIYDYISNHGDAVDGIAKLLGYEVDDDTFGLIACSAAERTDFSSGVELLARLKADHDAQIDNLTGDHKEVVAVINKRANTTLDRAALRTEFGEDYEAFNVDVWSFKAAAELIASSPEDARQKEVAMVYYNIATSLVLAGPGMRVVVLE